MELKIGRLCGGLENKELGDPFTKLSSGVFFKKKKKQQLFQLLFFSRVSGLLSGLCFFSSYCVSVAAAALAGVFQLSLHGCSCSGSTDDPSA